MFDAGMKNAGTATETENAAMVRDSKKFIITVTLAVIAIIAAMIITALFTVISINKSGIGELRSETQTGLSDLRKETQAGFREVRSAINQLHNVLILHISGHTHVPGSNPLAGTALLPVGAQDEQDAQPNAEPAPNPPITKP